MIVQLDGLWEQGEHLNFRNLGKPNPKAKTLVFSVQSRYDNSSLGLVKWFANWRQYTFFPFADTIFDKKCLTEIAEYCSLKTDQHKGFVTEVLTVETVSPVTE